MSLEIRSGRGCSEQTTKKPAITPTQARQRLVRTVAIDVPRAHREMRLVRPLSLLQSTGQEAPDKSIEVGRIHHSDL